MQISSIKLKSLRNGEFIQFMKDVYAIMSTDIKEKKLEGIPYKKWQQQLDKVEKVYKGEMGSTYTKDLEEIDQNREAALKGIRAVIRAYEYHYEEDKVRAARLLYANLRLYGDDITRLSYQQQTSVVDSLMKDWTAKGKFLDAIKLLHLDAWVFRLSLTNDSFGNTYLARVKEEASRQVESVITHRPEVEVLYKDMIAHLSAHALLGTVGAYKDIAKKLDVLVGSYNRSVEQRRRSSNAPAETSEDKPLL